MNREQIIEELEKKKRQSRALQKKIILIFLSVAILAAVIFAVIVLYTSGWFKSEEKVDQGGFLFDPNADENYDIMSDKAYLSILESEPFINLADAQTGVSESLLPENYGNEGAAVKLLTDLILSIQMGDSDAYNSCFSRAYLISEGKRKAAESEDPDLYKNYTDDQYMTLGRQRDFTMQQIYDVHITFLAETSDPAADTKTYTYEIEYKIRRNNGTFRTDLGSDVPRPQEITVFEDVKTGDISIISVTNFSSVQNKAFIHGWRIALVAVIAVLIIVTDIVFTVKLMKKITKNDSADKEISEAASDEGEEKDEETLGN